MKMMDTHSFTTTESGQSLDYEKSSALPPQRHLRRDKYWSTKASMHLTSSTAEPLFLDLKSWSRKPHLALHAGTDASGPIVAGTRHFRTGKAQFCIGDPENATESSWISMRKGMDPQHFDFVVPRPEGPRRMTWERADESTPEGKGCHPTYYLKDLLPDGNSGPEIASFKVDHWCNGADKGDFIWKQAVSRDEEIAAIMCFCIMFLAIRELKAYGYSAAAGGAGNAAEITTTVVAITN